MDEGSEDILTNIQEGDSRAPFTEVAGSDCCLNIWSPVNDFTLLIDI